MPELHLFFFFCQSISLTVVSEKAQENLEKESKEQESSGEGFLLLIKRFIYNFQLALEGSDEQGETAEGTDQLHTVIFPGIEQPKKSEFKSQEEKYV